MATVSAINEGLFQYLKAPDLARLSEAYQFSEAAHAGQTRQSGEPYISHPLAVTEILAGWRLDGQALVAALLHDVIEDTDYDVDQCRRDFPKEVTELVIAASEQKLDEHGQKLPWMKRKHEHIARLQSASVTVKALVLADKLHNLASMVFDIQLDPQFWSRFNARVDDILWYYDRMAELGTGADDVRLQQLARECLQSIERLRELERAARSAT